MQGIVLALLLVCSQPLSSNPTPTGVGQLVSKLHRQLQVGSGVSPPRVTPLQATAARLQQQYEASRLDHISPGLSTRLRELTDVGSTPQFGGLATPATNAAVPTVYATRTQDTETSSGAATGRKLNQEFIISYVWACSEGCDARYAWDFR